MTSDADFQDTLNAFILDACSDPDQLVREIEPVFNRLIQGGIRTVTRSTLNAADYTEIQQQVWESLLRRRAERRPFTEFPPARVWVWSTARFAIKHLFDHNHRYALYEDMQAMEDSVPEWTIHGQSSDPLSRVIEGEQEEISQTAAEQAMQRIRLHLHEIPEEEKTIYERRTLDFTDALILRGAMRNLFWSREQMADYLGVSINVVNNYLTARSAIPEELIERIRFAGAHLKTTLPTWPAFMDQAASSLGLQGIPLRDFLAERLGVSSRTLRRWLSGGKGSEKGMRSALALRDRNWMRD
ncbi:hypothetical protein A6M23_14780 [Acidithiobacillus thiooxidans]|uniref:Uncharacterized protein n=2 Tax=Acidithiobacillus thiooxidans TaxID=930 RepID=A0A1C2I1M3_ACITH|nr:helix-turn-helix transcriptional regulator [Acidithiobacillus thiooxidans]OCX69902.1 hypothetical protein A6M23_14780 [Acidithiobacillus thiooxidans]